MKSNREMHFSSRSGWLRAAVLGANDGMVSTASLIVGIAAAQIDRDGVLLAGFAGLVAGAMSMAAGEFVSVSTQSDAARADLAREKNELETNAEGELHELASIYEGRGLEPELAREVARQLMEHDALEAHARDELGLTGANEARPLQAAGASALAFAVGAALPLLVARIALYGAHPSAEGGAMAPLDIETFVVVIVTSTLVFLALLGSTAARLGGAKMWVGALRVCTWGALAMGATAAVGRAFGV